MADYYIDLSAATNGTGSEANPYNSLSSLPTLTAGDNVLLKRGSSQVMSATYTVSASGTVNNPIRFGAYGTGPLPRLTPVNDASVCINCTPGRSHIIIEDIEFFGNPEWTAEGSAALRLNGAGTGEIVRRCVMRWLGFGIFLDGGFSKTNLLLEDNIVTDCLRDGVRFLSTAGTYTWSGITIRGGEYSRNGRSPVSRGNGITFFIQNTHSSAIVENVLIEGVTADQNNRYGISLIDDSFPYTNLTAAANTTPPNRNIRGLEILHCKASGNGVSGIHVSSVRPSSTRPLRIAWNICRRNGIAGTPGAIWTGACLTPVIELNQCYEQQSNGTTVGDGCGIFDDQWNDGAIVRWNYIADNIFNPAINPEYTAFGIGIYRSSNGKHYGNVIVNCRYGFVIGGVDNAVAPIFAGYEVYNNTIIRCHRRGISLWQQIPVGSISIRNNWIVDTPQDIEALGGGVAGNQTYAGNAATNVTTKYVGNGVPSNAFNHIIVAPGSATNEGRPLPGSVLLTGGADLGYLRDIDGKQSRRFIGAYASASLITIG